MRFFRFSVLAVLVLSSVASFSGCSVEELKDNRDQDYGYVQFKLYKEASYTPDSRAVVTELDSLYQASKIAVWLTGSDGQEISQTLTLSAPDKDAAEYGMRSSKLRVVAGDYRLIRFTLYDGVDDPLYNGSASGNETFSVVPGGLTVHDLTANAKPRGFVRFRLIKDISDFTPPATKSSSVTRQFTMDEIDKIDITVVRTDDGSYTRSTFEDLPVDFSVHFATEDPDGNPVESDKDFGYRTSSSVCDTLVRIDGGEYQVMSYQAFDVNGSLLETREYESGERPEFAVADNEETTADVKVTLFETDAYIKDYYALHAIWEALDGENWSYMGESFTPGCTWNFNKDPDLWGDQPGVELHANGRVAKIDLTGFGINGEIPAQIGDLTELVELHLGSHNELKQFWTDDPVSGTPLNASEAEKAELRLKRHRAFTDAMHHPVQTSAPIALALREHNISIDAISSYDEYSKDEISAMAAGGRTPRRDSDISLFDMNTGKMTNNLTGIDPAISKLTKLEQLSIANSPITADKIPAEIANLESCTDLELYNCPNLGSLPEGLAKMPALIQVNLSNNNFGIGDTNDENVAYQALHSLVTGASKDQLQIVYFLYNNLRKVPVAEIADMSKLGMLDLSYNSIHGTIQPFGETFSPVEIYFDNNEIEAFENTDGAFWRIDDLDAFSANYNNLTEFPNVFTANTNYSLTSIGLAYNKISKFPSNFKGLKVETLTLTGNKFEAFPKELLGSPDLKSMVNYIILSANGMKEFPKDCFKSPYTSALISMDLTYNNLTQLPSDFNAETFPYLYGVDLSYNNFTSIPAGPLNSPGLTVYAVRGQRDENGERCLKNWFNGIYNHTGLRGYYVGSNDIGVIDDTISYLIYYLDISDNPNIVFDASDICYYWQSGAYILYYDKTQTILNCDAMLE